MLPISRGELGWGHPLATAVRAHLVVVLAPCRHGDARLLKILEPVLVETFVAKLAVETLHRAVLHGPTRFDQQVHDVMGLRAADESPTRKLRAVVGTHGHRIAAKDGGLIQQPRDVVPTNAEVASW